MTFRLAHDRISITHGEKTMRLRPSLRAGLLIAQKYTLEDIGEALAESNFTVITYLVMIGADDPDAALSFISGIVAHDGYWALAKISPELQAFVMISLGMSGDEDGRAEHDANLSPITFSDALTQLFETGTGWLGWSPSETWAATPAEIVAARTGLFAKLKAIHGSGEEERENDARNLPTDAEIAGGIARLRALSGNVL